VASHVAHRAQSRPEHNGGFGPAGGINLGASDEAASGEGDEGDLRPREAVAPPAGGVSVPADRKPPSSLVHELLARAGGREVGCPADDDLPEQCPYLWELLVLDRYADGTVRVLPSVRIERVHGGYEVTLQDHASNLQCSVYVSRLKDWPTIMEARMVSSAGAWRPFTSFKVRDPLKRAGGKKA
jgi:hypothetical protein